MLRGPEADQHPFALVKAEHRLIVEYVGHRPVRRRLARHGAGMGMAEMAVDAQGAEQVVRGDLLVDHLVQLLAAHRMVKGFPVLRLEPVITANGVFCSGWALRALPSARS